VREARCGGDWGGKRGRYLSEYIKKQNWLSRPEPDESLERNSGGLATSRLLEQKRKRRVPKRHRTNPEAGGAVVGLRKRKVGTRGGKRLLTAEKRHARRKKGGEVSTNIVTKKGSSYREGAVQRHHVLLLD